MKSLIFLILLLYLSSFVADESVPVTNHEADERHMVPDDDEDESDGPGQAKETGPRRVVNFASIAAGAVVLDSSPQSEGFKHLLSDDKDKYVLF